MTTLFLTDDSTDSKCIKCGADIAPTAKFCLKCGASHISSSPFFSKLRVRYQDAYAVARGLVTTGKIIKIAALVAGGVLLLLGIIIFVKNEGMLGGLEGLLLILLAGMVAGGGFITGILTAAIGQFMSATIDTAVNTSESITGDEKAEIVGLTE